MKRLLRLRGKGARARANHKYEGQGNQCDSEAIVHLPSGLLPLSQLFHLFLFISGSVFLQDEGSV